MHDEPMITEWIHETRRLFHFHLTVNEMFNSVLSGRTSLPQQTNAQNETVATPNP